MKETLQTINGMQADGVIGKYAIGGAVGATLYLEPAATLDIDIFLLFPEVAQGALVSLSPIYEYLSSRGWKVEGEHIVVGGWPVQFLTAADGLEKEAIERATPTEVEGVRTWVMTAEHLAAIALKAGRLKDQNRILQFLEQSELDRASLAQIIETHGLTEKWERFKKRYLDER